MRSDITIPLIISAGIHIGVIFIVAVSVDFSEKPKPQVQASAMVVHAVFVDQNNGAQHVERLESKKRETESKEKTRQDELERKVKQASEQAQIKNQEQQRKQKEIEIKNAAEAVKLTQLKEIERKSSEKAAKKATDELKRKSEAERKRKAEEEASRQQEQMMQDAFAAEQASLSQTRNKQVMSEVNRYTSMIVATISRNVQQEESMRGKSCTVFVRLAKDGFVTSSRIVDGDPVLCRATQAAIQKVQRLPISSEYDVYEKLKELNIIYRPKFN